MITISPAGLAGTALTANQLSLLVSIKEKLFRPYCINSTIQPQVSVNYSYDTPVLNGTSVFIPIKAVITIVTPSCKCNCCPAKTQLYTENFTAVFQDQTAVPTSIEITSLGRTGEGSDVRCCKANSYSYQDSLTITIA